MRTQPLCGAVLVRTLKQIAGNSNGTYSQKMDDMGRMLNAAGVMAIVNHSEVGGLYVSFTKNQGQTTQHTKDISISDSDSMANEIIDWAKLKGLIC